MTRKLRQTNKRRKAWQKKNRIKARGKKGWRETSKKRREVRRRNISLYSGKVNYFL